MTRKHKKSKNRERPRRKRERPPSPLMQSALEHHRAGRLPEAARIYESLLEQNPRHAEAMHFLGTIAMQQGNHRGAIGLTRRALEVDPAHPSYHFSLGTNLLALGELEPAIETLERCLALDPGFFQAHLNLADGLRAKERHPEAERYLTKALEIDPDSDAAMSRLGATRLAAGNLESALECFQRVARSSPGSADAHFDLADNLKRLGRPEEAIASLRTGLEIEPGNSRARNQLGESLLNAGCAEEAIQALQETLRQDPSLVEAHNNLGLALAETGDRQSALALFRKTLALEPNFAAAHYNLANTLERQSKLSEAIAAYREAIRCDPRYYEPNNNLGGVFQALGMLDEAQDCYRRALDLAPETAQTHSNLLFCLNYRNDLGHEDVFASHRGWGESHSLPPIDIASSRCDADRCLRIGYMSPDFREHSVAYFAEPVLSAHDASQFEIVAYADVTRPDAVTQRIRQAVPEWRDITGLDDEHVVELVQADKIDILVDLAGHTGRNRLRVFSAKPAPVQVTYIGYPNTTGLDAIDYRLTDSWADPVGETEPLHSEELIRLEGGFLCYLPPGNTPQTREPASLKRGHTTFGSFNNLAKVTPEVVSVWSEILTAVPSSRLLLKGKPFSDEFAHRRYQTLFSHHGVAADRVERVGRIESTDAHLDLYNHVDIALDPFPYNGTTTTCEAMWMGVPVISLAGQVHAGRVGVSLLSAIGAEDWIAENQESYVAKAVELARDTDQLCALRTGLRKKMRASPLMDAPGHTRRLERVYLNMWNRRLA